MLRSIAFYLIFGKPLLVYVGIITFIFLMLTAYFGAGALKDPAKFTVKKHKLLVKITLGLTLIHIILGLALLF